MAEEVEQRPLPAHLVSVVEHSVDRLLLTLLIGDFARRLDSPKQAQEFVDMLKFRVEEYTNNNYTGKGDYDAAIKKQILSSTNAILKAVKIVSGVK